ncbi:MAG: alpha/beta fold hydrolase [Deltaproteobacteria bacterium]|nr:MAG: alpha/beta fold hydrolase [Deltaproteobacteria bacterium]
MSFPLAYSDTGTGHPVVLIHGFPLCRHMWQPQAACLSRAGYRVICPDLPGFGESPPVCGPASMTAYADAVVALLDHLEIERAAIGGMSMGGYVLLNLVERYPQRLQAALYLVTRAAADDAAGKARRGDLAGAVRGGDREVVPLTFEKLLFAPDIPAQHPELVGKVRAWMEQASPEGVAGGLLAMRDRKDYVASLPNLQVPALVVGAAADLAVPPAHAEVLAAGLPDAELHLIAAAGHMVNLEQPEAFNRILLDFLGRRVRG